MDARALAVAYYTALGKKNMEDVKECLHANVQFSDPQEKVLGKEAVLKAAEGFAAIFNALTIHAAFGAKDQAVVVYDVTILGLSKDLRASSLLSFQDGLISHIELIYDTRALSG